jgi:hypothetical protein
VFCQRDSEPKFPVDPFGKGDFLVNPFFQVFGGNGGAPVHSPSALTKSGTAEEEEKKNAETFFRQFLAFLNYVRNLSEQ